MSRHRLFVYGTLLDPAVRRLVTGKADPCPPQPACLGHWHRGGIAGRPYPVIVPRPGSRVYGLLLTGLSPQALARLDSYETDEYRRISVIVRTARGGRRCNVYAAAGRLRLNRRRWSLVEWQVQQRHQFLARLRVDFADAGSRAEAPHAANWPQATNWETVEG